MVFTLHQRKWHVRKNQNQPRNGNGCVPAGMVAGKPAGGLSNHAGRDSAVVVTNTHQKKWHARKNSNQPLAIIRHLPFCHLTSAILSSGIASCQRDRIGEATGSLCLAVALLRDGGEPIGVVKLLGC